MPNVSYTRPLANIMKMTTIKVFVILLALMTISSISYACECPMYDLQKLDKESYQWCDVIVIGEVIKTGTNYKIKVVEVLKGCIERDTLNGTTVGENNEVNSCSYFPSIKGRYIFYLSKITKNGQTYYEYSQCDGTRLLNMEILPISLHSDKSKEELIQETVKWIEYLRELRKNE